MQIYVCMYICIFYAYRYSYTCTSKLPLQRMDIGSCQLPGRDGRQNLDRRSPSMLCRSGSGVPPPTPTPPLTSPLKKKPVQW